MSKNQFIEGVAKIVDRADSWLSNRLGFGLNDRVGASIPSGQKLSDSTLKTLYRYNDTARKIVSKLPEDALRRGFSVMGEEEEVELPEEVKDPATAIAEAATWGRLYGGGVIWVVCNVDPSQPLKPEQVRKVYGLHVLDKRSLQADRIDDDPQSARFGEPLTYRFTPVSGGRETARETGVVIHRDHLVIFPGVTTARDDYVGNGYWQDSVLFSCYRALQGFGTNWASFENLLCDASQSVFKLTGFYDAIVSDSPTATNSVIARMSLTDAMRSSSRAIILDAENEDFQRVATSFAGLPESLNLTMVRLASAANMPVTILWGTSPSGLNTTGEADHRAWAQTVESYQTNILAPSIVRLYQLLTSSSAPYEVTFEDPYPPTAQEAAQVRLLRAQEAQVYISNEVVDTIEVAKWLAKDSMTAGYDLDMDTREGFEVESLEDLLTITPQPEALANVPGSPEDDASGVGDPGVEAEEAADDAEVPGSRGA